MYLMESLKISNALLKIFIEELKLSSEKSDDSLSPFTDSFVVKLFQDTSHFFYSFTFFLNTHL